MDTQLPLQYYPFLPILALIIFNTQSPFIIRVLKLFSPGVVTAQN